MKNKPKHTKGEMKKKLRKWLLGNQLEQQDNRLSQIEKDIKIIRETMAFDDDMVKIAVEGNTKQERLDRIGNYLDAIVEITTKGSERLDEIIDMLEKRWE